MEQEYQSQDHEPRASARANRWLIGLVIVLAGAAVFAFAYQHRESQAVAQLSGDNQQMGATISQMRSQIDELSQKLTTLATPPPAPAAGTSGSAPVDPAAAKAARARRVAQEKRLKQMQSRLDDQQKELKQTEDDLAKTRSDFEGGLNSTRTELGGSIARTHDELVALAKRGERDYTEFDLRKGKQFQRSGPISVSLRRTDTKHKSYDLALLVDDNQLGKKHVNLYEPIWIHRADDPQPIQVVINKIDRDHVHGYVSAPKYRLSQLASSNSPTDTPVSSGPTVTTGDQPAPSTEKSPQQ
jgi:hypothetical protein